MAQITIYMDDDTAKRARRAALVLGISFSKWVTRLVQQRTQEDWPEAVRSLAGAWQDLPLAEESRAKLGRDAKRPRL